MKYGLGWIVLMGGIFLSGWVGSPEARAAETRQVERVGYAYTLNDGDQLYREIHRARWEGGQPVTEEVTYRGVDGEVMAVKTIDYRRSQQAPSFRMEMKTVRYREGLQPTEEGLRAFVLPVGERRERGDIVPGGKDLVVDAGFDRLIERRLADLKAGKRLTFRFLVPSRLEAYAFRAQMVERTRVLGQPALHVRMEPANVFLRWLADPVDVFYHWEGGRLLRYEGPSNLRRPDGDNPLVRVDFPRTERAETGW